MLKALLGALNNLRVLLKPGGVLALTVPYGFHESTIEHYPELGNYRIEGEGADRILVNVLKCQVPDDYE